MTSVGKGFLAPAATLLLLAAAPLGCSRPLPEAGSPSAELYRERCGTACHRPYAPSVMKFPAWRMVMPRMENLLRIAGTPLTREERDVIEAYLKKHSG
jgi:hypothetical protein